MASEIESIDSLLGTQLALVSGLKLVLMQYRENQNAIKALKWDLERTRSLLLGASLSEQTLAVFDRVAAELVLMIEPDQSNGASDTAGATPPG